jgi:choline dehydrogenase-like flavoprotein
MIVSHIPDIVAQGIAGGWKAHNTSLLERDTEVEADVLIIGTGAGGGTAAEILSAAGLRVVLVEEGPLKTSNDFNMQELSAFTDLYQDGMGRATKDGAITIMQGRCVGGSTTVNWTSSFRTPTQTLDYWATHFGVKGCSDAELAPWFARMEERLGITPWALPANGNNHVISAGCEALGWEAHAIPRNVRGCWNLGYCGVGCPTNAKQSMLVTTLPEALKQGAELWYLAQAQTLLIEGDSVRGVRCQAMKPDYVTPTGITLTIRAKHTVMACGGINGPGLLLRSGAPDPYRRIGKRTFMHPVPFSLAEFPQDIAGYSGAPQSVYSDHFQWRDGVSGPLGFKIEVAPMQPSFTSVVIMGHGRFHQEQMQKLPKLNLMLALLRDGFHEESQGGSVELQANGTPVVDYPLNDFMFEGARRALKTMAELQFAAGAKAVRPVHTQSTFSTSLKDAISQIDRLPLQPGSLRLGCAHVMGGLAMGEDPRTSVVNSQGAFHHLQHLSVMDGSVFPTSIGANPQLSIYGLVARNATLLADSLKKPA